MNTCNQKEIYHEKQVRELCALHALNNLFQCKDFFTKSELDEICNNLSPDNWINPHKSMLGIGNYDINVIMKALQSKDCEAIWFDKRKDPSSLNFCNIIGLIFNIPSDYKFSFITIPLNRRHWVAIKEIDGTFYNLDSKLDAPQIIGTEAEVVNFLKNEMNSKDKEMFVVVTNAIAENKTWLKDPDNYRSNDSNYNQGREAQILQLKDILPVVPATHPL